MSLVLNTNIGSLNAQNNLSGSQASLATSLERLSSGLRINSAADDAAGLAISQQFTTQINGTNQAVSNANDAVSETQTTAGALNTIVNNLQSIRTLAVEAANGSNSSSDRAALDQQVQQQIAEITQISQQTQFNGLSVLNGSSGNQTYQVGANVGDTISIDLAQGVGANQIGQTATYSPTAALAATSNSGATGALTIQVGTNPAVSIAGSASYATGVAWQDGTSAYAKAAAINAGGISGLTATANTTITDAAFANVTTTAGGTYNLAINGTTIFGGQSTAAGITTTAIVAQINQYSTQDGGVTATLNSTGGLVLNAADGSNIAITQSYTGGATGGLGAEASAGGVTTRGTISLSAGANITVGGTTAADLTSFGFALGTTALTAGSTLAQQNVKTVAAANATIESVDSALATVSAFQAQLGAIQNRFTAAVGNLTSTAQNLTQSRSTIQDADFAAETANLTQSQVLEQAGISVLAQANQQPQLILKLLQ